MCAVIIKVREREREYVAIAKNKIYLACVDNRKVQRPCCNRKTELFVHLNGGD